jgi:heavy metal-binding protein
MTSACRPMLPHWALIVVLLGAASVLAQSPVAVSANAVPAEIPAVFTCPMHPDVQSSQPGMCPRCRMTLVAKLPDRIEYPLALRLTPPVVHVGQPLELAFTVKDPNTGRQVTDFQVIHEKLYHLFIVSQDLQYFVHVHPEKGADSIFRFGTSLPRPGMYRILSDFYPNGGTPQLIAKSILVPGGPITPGTQLKPDLSAKNAENMRVSLTLQPEHPVAGASTILNFHLEPADKLEPYLGAWAHMLAASDDLIDMIHDHPLIADGGADMQFKLIFPRARVYRVWVQFQRNGVVNTAVFNVPLSESAQ